MPATLSITDLSYQWPGASERLLDISALTLNPGDKVFLRGPSGCGKSTLLSAIAGTIEIDPGQISVCGTDIGGLRGGARDRFRGESMGLIFQVFNLVPWMTALENVVLPCRLSPARRQRAGEGAEKEAVQRLVSLGLPETLLRAPARTLSIGQQQRVAAARALIGRPDLVLADEPTSALDDDMKLAFVDLLLRDCAEAGSALLFVSHDRSLEHRFDRAIDFRDLNGMGGTC